LVGQNWYVLYGRPVELHIQRQDGRISEALWTQSKGHHLKSFLS